MFTPPAEAGHCKRPGSTRLRFSANCLPSLAYILRSTKTHRRFQWLCGWPPVWWVGKSGSRMDTRMHKHTLTDMSANKLRCSGAESWTVLFIRVRSSFRLVNLIEFRLAPGRRWRRWRGGFIWVIEKNVIIFLPVRNCEGTWEGTGSAERCLLKDILSFK